jgi:signal transduction histidine kinase
LAIVNYILKLHGLHLSVSSEPDKGTTICFDLPAEEANQKK